MTARKFIYYILFSLLLASLTLGSATRLQSVQLHLPHL
jgi:hypothetical protein